MCDGHIPVLSASGESGHHSDFTEDKDCLLLVLTDAGMLVSCAFPRFSTGKNCLGFACHFATRLPKADLLVAELGGRQLRPTIYTTVAAPGAPQVLDWLGQHGPWPWGALIRKRLGGNGYPRSREPKEATRLWLSLTRRSSGPCPRPEAHYTILDQDGCSDPVWTVASGPHRSRV